MELKVTGVKAVEILDSRGNPDPRGHCRRSSDGTLARGGRALGCLDGLARGRRASRRRYGPLRGQRGPQSRGKRERRDRRRRSRAGASPISRELDGVLIELDGTENKSRLGANAIVGVSMAAARAMATAAGVPLWRALNVPGVTPRLPVPHFNVLNGGAHAPNELDFQEFMVAPLGAPSMAEAVRAGAEVYVALRKLLSGEGSRHRPRATKADSPRRSKSPRKFSTCSSKRSSKPGYKPGRDGVAIAMDPAASEFYDDGGYHVAGERLSSGDMIDRYEKMIARLPDLEPGRRLGRGRLGRLGTPHRTARRADPARGRRPARHEPGDHRRGDRPAGGERRLDQGQPDRQRHRDA